MFYKIIKSSNHSTHHLYSLQPKQWTFEWHLKITHKHNLYVFCISKKREKKLQIFSKRVRTSRKLSGNFQLFFSSFFETFPYLGSGLGGVRVNNSSSNWSKCGSSKDSSLATNMASHPVSGGQTCLFFVKAHR